MRPNPLPDDARPRERPVDLGNDTSSTASVPAKERPLKIPYDHWKRVLASLKVNI